MGLDDRVIVGLLLLLLAAMVGGSFSILYSYKEKEEVWLRFREERHCRIVGEMTGGYKTPPKTGWLCDDGKTYWR